MHREGKMPVFGSWFGCMVPALAWLLVLASPPSYLSFLSPTPSLWHPQLNFNRNVGDNEPHPNHISTGWENKPQLRLFKSNFWDCSSENLYVWLWMYTHVDNKHHARYMSAYHCQPLSRRHKRIQRQTEGWNVSNSLLENALNIRSSILAPALIVFIIATTKKQGQTWKFSLVLGAVNAHTILHLLLFPWQFFFFFQKKRTFLKDQN